MKGLILVFNDQKQVGAIATTSGKRYLFPIKDWKEDLAAPERGLMVEFEAGEDNRARNVRLALPDAPQAEPARQVPVEVVQVPPPYVPTPKKKSVLTLLTLFLGLLGVQKFYMGAWGWGIVYIAALILSLVLMVLHPLLGVFYTLLFCFVLAEAIRYILMSDAQFDAKVKAYQARRPGPFSFFW